MFLRATNVALQRTTFPDRHIIPLLPSLSWLSAEAAATRSLASPLQLAFRGPKLNLISNILRVNSCLLQAGLGLFCARKEGCHHQGLHSQLRSQFQHTLWKQKLKWEENSCCLLCVHLHRGKGMLCSSTTAGENKAVPCFHLQ